MNDKYSPEHDRPNPRSFSEYDEYLAALQEWEWWEDQKNDPDGAKAKEAEMRIEIWARFAKEGRVPRCIPSCRKPLCLEMEGCIWVHLQLIQKLWNEWFFGDALPDEKLLLNEELQELFEGRRSDPHRKLGLCSVLPEVWQKEGAYEHQVLRFFLNVWDVISFEKEKPALCAFARDVYNFTFCELWTKPCQEKEKILKRIEQFLSDDETMPRVSSMLLSQEVQALQQLREAQPSSRT